MGGGLVLGCVVVVASPVARSAQGVIGSLFIAFRRGCFQSSLRLRPSYCGRHGHGARTADQHRCLLPGKGGGLTELDSNNGERPATESHPKSPIPLN